MWIKQIWGVRHIRAVILFLPICWKVGWVWSGRCDLYEDELEYVIDVWDGDEDVYWEEEKE